MTTNLEKLQTLLRELFQLDQADLDFGIYRIMNHSRDEIVRFLKDDLLPQVQEGFGEYEKADQERLQFEREQLIEQAKALGLSQEQAENTPKVKEIQQKLQERADIEVLEQEVYAHLYNFFRRYYQEGDFLSLRRYKEGVYAIPYEGEEVKLHWANADQYYIKSSEYFRNYAFKLPSERRVRFEVVAATTEKDNNKAPNGKERRFIVCDAEPVMLNGDELVVRFEYRVDEEKRDQATLNKLAHERLMALANSEEWQREFEIKQPTEKNPERTLLEKYLIDFTAKNTFDYFIHKDLGGFLRRELDFYIKSEVIRLEDIEHEAPLRVKHFLSKVKVLRSLGNKIIKFLAQIEDFQKKLWLKKKFVLETNYCITLDRVPEELYPEVIGNEAQHDEWVQLFAINEIKETFGDLFRGGTPSYSTSLTIDFLKANNKLLLDTRFFDETFKARLLGSIENFDEQCDGLLIHSENFQALHLLQERYREQVKCIYIDPPYNTSSSSIPYKNNYQHSSWGTLMYDRLAALKSMLTRDGAIFVSIDKVERTLLEHVMDLVFGAENRVEELICWVWQEGDASMPATKQSPSTRDPEHPNFRFYKPLHPVTDKPCPHPKSGWKFAYDDDEDSPDKRSFVSLDRDGRIAWGKDEKRVPRLKRMLHEVETNVGKSVFQDYSDGEKQTSAMFGQSGIFLAPKHADFVSRFILHAAKRGSIIVDCFGGSGSTAHAVIKLNRDDHGTRKYILVEVGNYFDTVLKPRVLKAVYSGDWKDGKPISRNGISHCIKYIRLESYEDTLNNIEKQLPYTQKELDFFQKQERFWEEYMLSYKLDTEARGSGSLLNQKAFIAPFSYQLKVIHNDDTRYVTVDLVETFNYLLGLTVQRSRCIDNVRIVQGVNRQDDRVLILWRNLNEVDNDALDAWFIEQGFNNDNPQFDLVYINGDNNLENLRPANQTWRVLLTDAEFHRLMFDVQDV